jgi:hypothetical protein
MQRKEINKMLLFILGIVLTLCGIIGFIFVKYAGNQLNEDYWYLFLIFITGFCITMIFVTVIGLSSYELERLKSKKSNIESRINVLKSMEDRFINKYLVINQLNIDYFNTLNQERIRIEDEINTYNNDIRFGLWCEKFYYIVLSIHTYKNIEYFDNNYISSYLNTSNLNPYQIR